MTLLAPTYLQALGASGSSPYDAASLRRLTKSMLSEGTLGVNDLKVAPRAIGANMSVDVAGGAAVVHGDTFSTQGAYLCTSTALENRSVNAAPPTGQSRIDIVVARIRDSQVDSGGVDNWTIEVIPGAPSGSPATPATPPSAHRLATILIGDSTTSISTGNITDFREWATAPGSTRMRNKVLADQYATANFATWDGSADFTDRWGQVNVRADLRGMLTAASSSAAVYCQWYVQLSLNGGVTWITGPTYGTLSNNTLDPGVFTGHAYLSGRAAETGTVMARAQIRQLTAGNYAQFTGGRLYVTVDPA